MEKRRLPIHIPGRLPRARSGGGLILRAGAACSALPGDLFMRRWSPIPALFVVSVLVGCGEIPPTGSPGTDPAAPPAPRHGGLVLPVAG